MLETKPLSTSDYKTILKLSLDAIKEYETHLLELRESKASLTKRWGAMIDIFMPLQMQIAKNYLPDEPVWVLSFNQHLNECKASDPSVKRLDEEKWAYLLETSFGITDIPAISLEKAQAMARDIAASYNNEERVAQLESIKETSAASEVMYDLMMALEMPVFEEHGFKGETGYIVAQKAILEFFDDPLIVEYGKHVHQRMMGQVQDSEQVLEDMQA